MSRPALPLALLAVSLFSGPLAAEDWPQFRGPTGQGLSAETDLPVEWGPDKNVVWEAAVPGTGWSSPIVQNGRVYLTSAVPVEGGEPDDQHLTALCLDAATGKTLWSRVVFEQKAEATDPIHGKNSHASATPATDGKFVFVHFGTLGTACLTIDGELVWANRELHYRPQHGNGGSPVLEGNVVLVICDGSDVQFVAAFDRATGAVRWKRDRPSNDATKKFAFCTPLVIDVDGERQAVCPGADQVNAYRPADGKPLWSFDYVGYSIVPRPAFGHGLLYLSTSFDRPTLYALRPSAGNRPPEAVWESDRAAPHTPSPLLVGDELYTINDRGIATCADARTGKVHWVERIGGNHSASPCYADGNVYFQNEDGGSVVVKAETTYREVARNALPGRTLASYAIADGSIFLRTDTRLYRLGGK